MVANRASIIDIGQKVAQLVLDGKADTVEANTLATRLLRLCVTGGSYKKRYDDPVERVLMRHLNLYRNKLKNAVTDVDRLIWRDKLRAQEKKVAAYKAGEPVSSHVETSVELDLDGL